MGRPKGSKNRPKVQPGESAAAAINGNGAEPGHNAPMADITEDQRQALALQHKKRRIALVEAKDRAVAALRNQKKMEKAELGQDGPALIDDMTALDTEEGEARVKADIERKMRAARYMAAPLGNQFGLFDDEDRTPAVDRARAEGRRAGMEGVACKPPYDPSVPQHAAWIEGWQDGQKALFAIQRTEDGEAFDAADALPGGDPDFGEDGEGATAH